MRDNKYHARVSAIANSLAAFRSDARSCLIYIHIRAMHTYVSLAKFALACRIFSRGKTARKNFSADDINGALDASLVYQMHVKFARNLCEIIIDRSIAAGSCLARDGRADIYTYRYNCEGRGLLINSLR